MAQQEVDPGHGLEGVSLAAVPSGWIRRMRLSPWWMLAIVTLLYCSAAIDRGGMVVLVNPIKADLGLTDVQMSLLMGFAYSFVQCVLLLPIGYLIDRFNRRVLLSCAVVLWSSVSAMTGFAGNFFQLLAARSGLAAGEASIMPAAHSLIRDGFKPERIGIAFSIYLAGISIAGSISLLVSGALIAAADGGFFHGWPVLGHFKTWQIVLAVPGLCTLPMALVALSMREPPRRKAVAFFKSDVVSNREALRYMWDHRWVYGPYFFAVIFSGYSNGALLWMPTAFIRGWGISAADYARTMGSITLVASIAGTFASGYLMDFVTRRRIPAGPLRVFLLFMATAFAFDVAALHVQTPVMVYTMLGIAQFFFAGHYAPLSITLSSFTPSRLFGRVTALYFLIIGLLGGNTWGPTAVALIAQHFFADRGALGIIPALNLTFAVAVPVGLLLKLNVALAVERFARVYKDGID